jgi:phage pi2 protein 07
MEAVILTKDQYQELVVRMDEIKSALTEKQKEPKDVFLDNQDFLQLMNISKRTAQSWRDEGIISFSQVGSKIYYRMSDVQKLLDSNYNQAFKKMSINPVKFRRCPSLKKPYWLKYQAMIY